MGDAISFLVPALAYLGFPGVAAAVCGRSLPVRVIWFVATLIVCYTAIRWTAPPKRPASDQWQAYSSDEEAGQQKGATTGLLVMCFWGTTMCVVSAATGHKRAARSSRRGMFCARCGQKASGRTPFCESCGNVLDRPDRGAT